MALLCSGLAGCTVVSTVTGVVAGIATGTATGNPVIGVSVGIAVKAGVDEAGRFVSRKSQQDEQDAIAAVAGALRLGESGSWEVKHRMTRTRERGEVRVIRLIKTPLTVCKEVAFSVIRREHEKASRSWFTTSACQHGDKWKWAAVEPAVDRWGNLQ
jgi:hypothetical protein